MNSPMHRHGLRDIVVGAIVAETGLPAASLSGNEPFDTYGVESVLAVAIVRRLEETFGELSKTLLFEFSTINTLVEHLTEEYGATIRPRGDTPLTERPHPGPAAPLAEAPAVATRDAAPVHDRGIVESSPRRHANSGREPIAIVGISGRFPLAHDLEEFWLNLKTGRDCITEIPKRLWDWRDYWTTERGVPGKSYSRWGGFIEDSDRFDPLFFGISNLQAETMDPQERVFLETVHHVFEDAGYTRDGLREKSVGLYVAAMWGSYQHYGVDDAGADSSFSSIANRASYVFGLTGPSIALDTTCSGALTALHLACESLANGECDLAVAGGVNITSHPQKYLVLSRLGFAAPDGRCRSFGADAGGYVPGDGSSAVLLRPLQAAIDAGDRIHAVILGSAINHGGRSSGFTVPNADSQATLIGQALEKAGIDANTVSYIEAHAPGTALGDPIEVRGLTSVFRKHTSAVGACPIGSVKSNIGHLESAAGMASLAKVVMQLRNGQIAPSLHAEQLNPNINFDSTPFYVNRELAPWRTPAIEVLGRKVSAPRRAGISGFGAGGSNAHVIVEEYDLPTAQTRPATEQLIVLSAKTEAQLRDIVKRLRQALVDRLAATQTTVTRDDTESVADRVIGCVSAATNVRAALLQVTDHLSELVLGDGPLDHLATALAETFGHAPPAAQLAHLSIAELIDQLSTTPASKPAAADEALLEQIAYTLQVGREAMTHRFATIARSVPDLIERLDDAIAGRPLADAWTGILPATIAAAAPETSEAEQRFVRRLTQERQYERLAGIWIAGGHVPWRDMYPLQPSRIALPLYPFARERCWVRPTSLAAAGPAVSFVPADEAGFAAAQRLCYRPEWRPLDSSRPATRAGAGVTLLVYPVGAAPLAESFKRLLPGAVWEIALGTRTELVGRRKWVVDAADPQALVTCLEFVEKLGTIWFFGGNAASEPIRPGAPLDRRLAQGLISLFRLGQWLARRDLRETVQLRIVTNFGGAVTTSEPVDPCAAAMIGFTRSFAREHPEIACDMIDLAINDTDALGIAGTRADLQRVVDGVDGHRQCAIRNGRLYTRHLVPHDPARPRAPVFRRGGTYVLIGGAGTVGSRLSRLLAERAHAQLVWVGRRPHDASIAAAQDEIARLGGNLVYHAADAGDATRLAAVFDEVEQTQGGIDGVFHLCKANEIVRIRDLEEAGLTRIVGAKTATSAACMAALATRKVGFVVLFSSAEAHVGSLGWSGYAAGCSFQDALALDWSQRTACPVVAINWGYWEGVGDDVAGMLATKGIHPLDIETGLVLLETALGTRAAQLTALDVDAAVLERMGFEPRLDRTAPASSAALPVSRAADIKTPDSAPAGSPITALRKFDLRHFDPATFNPEEYDPASFPSGDQLPSHASLATELAGVIADVLRIDRSRIEYDADLITYGIDSLTVIALHKTLESRAGSLPATLFIQVQTINAVATELLQRFPVAACALAGGRTGTVLLDEPSQSAKALPDRPARGPVSVQRLGHAAPADMRDYLEAYGSRFHDHSLTEAAASVAAEPLVPNRPGERGLDHLLVNTGTLPAVELMAAGDGIPVVLLPAVGLTAPTWRHQLESALTEAMRLNVLHVPGYGLTKPISDCTSAGVTQAMAAWIDAIVPDRPVHIVASCLGCVTGMNLARLFPQRIASLTLVGGFYDTSDMNVRDPAKLTTDELTALLNGAVDRIRDDFAAVDPPSIGPAETPDAQRDLLLHSLCANAIVALRYLTEMLTLPVLDWLPSIKVPTQCIYGTKDVIVRPHHSVTIAKGIPGARLVPIEGAAHFPYLTHSAAFNPLMARFIAEQEAALVKNAQKVNAYAQ